VTGVGDDLTATDIEGVVAQYEIKDNKLRIEGEGEAKIYSIAKTIEEGSDM
jgi:hypothetical protein